MTIRPGDRRIDLAGGKYCILRPRPLPLLPTYHVFFMPAAQGPPTLEDERELFVAAQREAEELGVHFYGDPGCFTLLFNGPATRRRPWPHVHMLAVRNLAEKRKALFWLYFKRLLARLPKRGSHASRGFPRSG